MKKTFFLLCALLLVLGTLLPIAGYRLTLAVFGPAQGAPSAPLPGTAASESAPDSAAVPEHVDFMFIAKYIERMADHATNIAEWAIFIDTGVHPNLNDTQAGK